MRPAWGFRLAAFGLAGVLALPAKAQGQAFALRDVELELGGGLSVTDANAWVAPGQLTSSNKLTYGGVGRVFLLDLGRVRAGFELGHFNFWSYHAIFGTSFVLDEVQADHVGVVTRFLVTPRIAVDVGAAAQLFEGFTDPGLHAALRYAIPIKPEISMPIGLRADLILDSHTTLMPLMLTVGFSLKP